MKKIRLDQLLADRELALDLKEAAAFIMAGLVYSGEQKLEKPGEQVGENLPLSVRTKEHPFVSRGGLKLAEALRHWKLNLAGLRCVDLGSSTGGFSDCMLKAGASRIYAVDSGSNQLDWKLRQDPRVSSMENTNARDLRPEALDGPVDFATLDLSFISLEKIFPVLPNLLKSKAFWVALVKPQFEAPKNEVPAGGVIVDADLRKRICDRIQEAARAAGLGSREIIESPIRGKDGNIEFLLLGQKE